MRMIKCMLGLSAGILVCVACAPLTDQVFGQLKSRYSVHEGQLLEIKVREKDFGDIPSDLSVILFDAPLETHLAAPNVSYQFRRASEATYYDAQGKLIHVAANVPRFVGDGRGYLAEGRRLNLVTNSIDLDSAPWLANFDGTARNAAGIAPDGSHTASLVTGGASPYAGRKIPVALLPIEHYETPKGMYSLKVHMKAGDATVSRVGIYNNTRLAWEANVDVAWQGSIPSIKNSFNAQRVYLKDTGYEQWWILTFRFLPDATTTIHDATYLHVEPDRTASSRTIQVWGCQLEPGHLSTSYIHNTSGSVKVRAADILEYAIGNYALGLPSNNLMVEWEYSPRWNYGEVRGWHPRFWGSKVDAQHYFLARTSRSSRNFVATRTTVGDALMEDVTLGPRFMKDDRVKVAVSATAEAGLEILPAYMSDGVRHPQHNQRQRWGQTLMVGNLTDHAVSNMSPNETDGPLGAPIRGLKIIMLNADQPNPVGASFVNGVFRWMPKAGDSLNSPYTITFRATDRINKSVNIERTVQISVNK